MDNLDARAKKSIGMPAHSSEVPQWVDHELWTFWSSVFDDRYHGHIVVLVMERKLRAINLEMRENSLR